MSDIDLDSMPLSELKKLHKDVEKAIATFEDRHKADARAKLDAMAREMGYSLDELASVATPKRGRKTAAVAPKYRHPENASVTWSGRGRRPQWFVAALDAGKSADDLAIG